MSFKALSCALVVIIHCVCVQAETKSFNTGAPVYDSAAFTVDCGRFYCWGVSVDTSGGSGEIATLQIYDYPNGRTTPEMLTGCQATGTTDISCPPNGDIDVQANKFNFELFAGDNEPFSNVTVTVTISGVTPLISSFKTIVGTFNDRKVLTVRCGTSNCGIQNVATFGGSGEIEVIQLYYHPIDSNLPVMIYGCTGTGSTDIDCPANGTIDLTTNKFNIELFADDDVPFSNVIVTVRIAGPEIPKIIPRIV